ncbi:MAG: AbrB/MazE/SpoVT family DNA-binding domain-containing protein [Gemmatimonadetes bacterium]|nr:AbrB/MazE/SpoVT family DNA-binding domain-containing protein [Gemmatimonadota bacterium]
MTRRAKLFLNGRSQAVRLPKEFRFPGDEVEIARDGDAVVLRPVEGRWARVLRSLPPGIDDATAADLRALMRANRRRRTKPVTL